MFVHVTPSSNIDRLQIAKLQAQTFTVYKETFVYVLLINQIIFGVIVPCPILGPFLRIIKHQVLLCKRLTSKV